MNAQTIAILVLSSTQLATAAPARDLQRPRTEAEAPTTAGTAEFFDHGKAIKIRCESIQFQSRSSSNETSAASCQGQLDENAPLLLEYLNKQQRFERAVLSIQPQKGRAYAVELSDVMINDLDLYSGPVEAPTVAVNLSASTSRITLPPR